MRNGYRKTPFRTNQRKLKFPWQKNGYNNQPLLTDWRRPGFPQSARLATAVPKKRLPGSAT